MNEAHFQKEEAGWCGLTGWDRGRLTPGQWDRGPHARQEYPRCGTDRCTALRWKGLGKAEHKSEDRETSLWRESERGEAGVALGTLDSTWGSGVCDGEKPELLLIYVIAVLRCNSQYIQPTHLKCTVQWFLAHSPCCVTITSVQFQNISITPEGNYIPISSHSSLPQPLASINLLSISMDLPVLNISY